MKNDIPLEKDILRLASALALNLAAYLAIQYVYRDRDIPNPEFLSRELFFQIGNEVITAPAVAVFRLTVPPRNDNPLPRYRTDVRFGKRRIFPNDDYKAAMLDLAADQNGPAVVSGLEFYIGVYGSTGEYLISGKICQLLTKKWS